MISRKSTVIFITVAVVAVLLAGTAIAQPAPRSIWQLAPSNSLLVAGVDWRPDNPSVRALRNAEDGQTRDTVAKQQADIRKAIEDMSLLFGVSLDFTKDIDSWAGQQWAFIALPDGKNSAQPVFLIASSDQAAAMAALQKMIEPWQRLGEITVQPDTDFSITSFKTKDKSVEVYASAFGPVVALSPSKAALKQALRGEGFPADSPASKALTSLSDSFFYLYADPSLLKRMGMSGGEMPITGLAVGVSVVDKGAKVQALGFVNPQVAAMMKTMLPEQHGTLTVNPGIPSSSLVAASVPNLNSLSEIVTMHGMISGTESILLNTVQALSDTQVSAAMTAVLPTPTGVATIQAQSEQAASQKLSMLLASAKQMNFGVKPTRVVSGVNVTPLKIPNGPEILVAQIGSQVVMAMDGQSLASVASTLDGQQPSMSVSETYKETMANLQGSNLLTLYANLAPLQGLGYLADGLGAGQVSPLYGVMARSLENVKALGIGAGFDGQTASATIFLRTKPGGGATIAPVALSTVAIGAAVLVPVFARARGSAQQAACMSNMNQLALAARMYSQDHNGKLPTRANWQAQLGKYYKGGLECPSDPAIFYAFNKNLSGLDLKKIKNPDEVIMFFEAEPGLPNASGGRMDAILPHNGRGNFAYADGHVRQSVVPDQSHWVPQYPSTAKPVKRAPAKPKHHR